MFRLNRFKRFYRWIKYKIYELRYGFNPSDCWSLDYSLSKWLHPRLVHFRNNLCGHPSNITYEKWEEILDKMIFAFKNIADDDPCLWTANNPDFKKVEEGLDLFREYFHDLWN